ncbi:hypothetical protein F5I97DRAFT_1860039 [Phlebopus sp. FC_14]|nr:hypothetical protein F5I97DRAFT_1860039 [Phlebopus sp. FC_14]
MPQTQWMQIKWTPCPVYESINTRRSSSRMMGSHDSLIFPCGDSGARYSRQPSDRSSNPTQSFLQMESQDGVTYTYSLVAAGDTPLQFFILVEPEPDRPNYYNFSLPAGCLHHLRVWLRTTGIDHRLFGDNDLWIGRDPDFRSIGDASFASLRNATQDTLIYRAVVGRAHVTFIVRWRFIETDVYALSLEYEAGGAGRTLFDDYHLRLDCEPQTLSFMIYSIPATSTPAGASHRLRFWLRTPFASQAEPQPAESYLYQRLWKTDEFKLGASLNFEVLGHKQMMAIREPNSSQFDHDQSTYRRRSRLPPPMTVPGERVSDR